MRKLRFRTVFSRMLLLQSIAAFAVILLIGGTLLTVVRVQNIQAVQAMLYTKSQAIDDALEAGAPFEETAGAIAEDGGYLIERIRTKGSVRSCYSDPKWEPYAAYSLENTAYSRVASGASAMGDFCRGYFDKADMPILTLCRSIAAGEETALLLIHTDLSDLNRQTREMMLWLVSMSLLSFLGAVLLSYYNTHRLIDPFVEINHIVRCYSRGDFSRRINIKGRDEAAQLGRSFNEMAEQIKDLDDTRRSFVANVSHELRSPLTSMKGFLEAMQDGTIPQESYPEYIDIVLGETRRMASMVNDLLDLSRIESGMIELHYETFDINELIRRTLITFEARLTEQQMEMEVRFAQEQCFVYADSAQIGQVLRNLIDNAIKYSGKGQTICVSTYSVRREVYVSVKDNGVGIPQEDIPHVFDRFYKVEKAHTPSPTVGSGLGLSIVKRIIEQHGQTITVRSARGRGTQFTFSLERASMMKRMTDGGKHDEE
ncbi:MAG: HAMP domain-containing protein [Clostridia bacterium]|nr:HAMP domain-containing protein [Clostridia bacterium]